MYQFHGLYPVCHPGMKVGNEIWKDLAQGRQSCKHLENPGLALLLLHAYRHHLI